MSSRQVAIAALTLVVGAGVGWLLVRSVASSPEAEQVTTAPGGPPTTAGAVTQSNGSEATTPTPATEAPGAVPTDLPVTEGPVVEAPAATPTVPATQAPVVTPSPEPTTAPTSAVTYVFPVQPSDAASYGRDHHDYPATDIFAPCGTQAVAATAGRVDEVSRTDPWDPAVDDPSTRGGLSVSIVGDDGVRYYGSHFASIADAVQPGAVVAAGEVLGAVGRSGNAASTPCHLHFGISPPGGPGDWQTRRGVVWPWPYLDAWRDGGNLSPVAEVAAYAGRA